jgi:hypothetical protein
MKRAFTVIFEAKTLQDAHKQAWRQFRSSRAKTGLVQIRLASETRLGAILIAGAPQIGITFGAEKTACPFRKH